jgi:hypothetical protein
MKKGKRTRYNPLEETSPEVGDPAQEDAVAAMSRPDAVLESLDKVERIERLRPSQMIPDRFQPRRLLPGRIRRKFFNSEIDCYQAAKEWLKLSEKDAGWKQRVQELLDMGGSFEEQGQIKPITGAWIPSQSGGYVFRIETGERRFWAACLLAVRQKLEAEPELRVEVVSMPTRSRQVLENRHAQSPSAVGQACEVAALMLEEMNIEPDPSIVDEYDFFKQALKKRAPRGFWSKLEPVMQYSTRRMQQLLAILQLPPPLLEIADRHRIPERVLREIIALPEGAWDAAVKKAARENLTSEEIAQFEVKAKKTKRQDDARRSPGRIAFSGLRRFARAALAVEEGELVLLLDEVANEVVVQGFAQELQPILKGLESRIVTRLKAME